MPTTLTKLTIRNFKRFQESEIELGSPVVFVGPNNSGKTTAMQALALWDLGLKRWREKFKDKPVPKRRSGVAINRRDLLAAPVPRARDLWWRLRLRDVVSVHGSTQTANVCIEITVEGETDGTAWRCGLEFDFANEESFYCRPLRLNGDTPPERMPVPDEAGQVPVALLPPMSGLAANETMLPHGAINVRIGEGRTAEVLRNLCYQIYEQREHTQGWDELCSQMQNLFGVELDPPESVPARGEIAMTYREHGVTLDLSASGRGFQQTLLLLAYMHTQPNSILMLDEPDAHLEILRQRETYHLINDVAQANRNQLLIATHSEVLLNEAAGTGSVIAFVGKPHPLDGQRQEVVNALAEFGYQHYLQAEETGWVLYLEGSTDLLVLRRFAQRLDHPAAIDALERAFVHYVGNQPAKVRRHFHSMRAAVPQLLAVALFDNLGAPEPPDLQRVVSLMWRRNEIENYLVSRAGLEAYAATEASNASPGPLFTQALIAERVDTMRQAIDRVRDGLRALDRPDYMSAELKGSAEVLQPIFNRYFDLLERRTRMRKRDLHQLIDHLPDDEIDPEIVEKLDAIAEVAARAWTPD